MTCAQSLCRFSSSFFYLALGGNIKHDECLHRTVALLIPFISLHIENLTFLWLLIVAMVSQ